MSPTLRTFLLTTSLLLSVPALCAAAQGGFCSAYKQVASNAGHCPTCRIYLKPDGALDRLVVTANNGWSAGVGVSYRSNQAAVASGHGKWKDSIGATYSGHRFRLDLARNRDVLVMTMSIVTGEGRRLIKGRFRCADPKYASERTNPDVSSSADTRS